VIEQLKAHKNSLFVTKCLQLGSSSPIKIPIPSKSN
jgi:hypothetical protein